MVVKLLGNQRSGSDRILKYSPRKVLGKKFHQSLLILKAFNDIVRYKKNFFLEVRDNGSIQCLMCIVKKLAGFKYLVYPDELGKKPGFLLNVYGK